jgi:peptide/nickel transport system permease protein
MEFERAITALTGTEPEALSFVGAEGVAPWRRLVRRFRKNRSAMLALGFLVFVVLVAVLAPLLAPDSPTSTSVAVNQGPSAAHWLGTDDVGGDILSKLMYGAQVSMRACSQIVFMATAVALPLGLVAGYFGKWTDAGIMRVMDALFTFPPLVLALAVAALLGPSITNVSIAIAIVFVPGFTRLIRAQVLAVREETFMEASRSVGAGSARMMAKHLLPNVSSPLIVQVALSFGFALLAEAGLSFLGFGVQIPSSSWGTMLGAAYPFMLDKPWPMFPPGIAIFLTVLAFNLVGDGLRDSLGRETFRVKGDR